ncbi:MAG: NAD(P)-dependent oxidoreductase, partial [Dehalococcoidia bacterium]|nr:NAD(P)-dependent oxidoreductase [Dehalococcoidia bacterium]
MTVYISDCGGVLGPPLVRWLLEHSGAAIVGTNSDHENMGPLLTASRFRFYVVADRDDSALLRRVSDHPDVVVVLSAVERPGEDSIHTRNRADLVQSCAEIGARLVYVTPEWGDGVDDVPADAPLTRVIRAEAERETRELTVDMSPAAPPPPPPPSAWPRPRRGAAPPRPPAAPPPPRRPAPP